MAELDGDGAVVLDKMLQVYRNYVTLRPCQHVAILIFPINRYLETILIIFGASLVSKTLSMCITL